MDRRSIIRKLPLAAVTPWLVSRLRMDEQDTRVAGFRHSVCRWCFPKYTLRELCDIAQQCGITAIDLLHPEEWDVVLQSGLEVSLSNGSKLGITRGFNDPANHAELQRDLLSLMPPAADKGIGQVIVLSGSRNGRSDEAGLEACAVGLEPVVREAERRNVRVIMELLNSKIDHPDYQCD